MISSLRISWPFIIDICNRLSKEIKLRYNDLSQFDIITVSRGGLIPATLIAHQLDIKNIYTYIDGKTCTKSIPDEDRRLLFIDDILDTGKTRDVIRLAFFNYDIKYVFTVAKQLVPDQPRDLPGTYFIGLWVDNRWVVFPWEKKV